MTPYYLKFTDEAAANAVLFPDVPTAWDEEGNVIATEPRQSYHNTDVIGVIQKPTGEVDAEGGPVMAPLDGWHVNVLLADGEDGEALEPFSVTPAVPVRIWG